MEKQVSILIPTYNRAHLITETLNSIVQQAYENWECIVVDDHSNDNTQQVVEEYITKDSRFQYCKRPDDKPKGANACRNYGIEKSNSEYVIFLDSEDFLGENCLKDRMKAVEKHPTKDGVIFTMERFPTREQQSNKINKDPKGKLDSTIYLKMFLAHQLPWAITCPIWKKEALNAIGGFDESLQRLQDVDLSIRLLLNNVEVKRIQKTDCFYKIDETGDAKYKDIKFIKKAVKSFIPFINITLKNIDNRSDTKELQAYVKSSVYIFLKNYIFPNHAELNEEKKQLYNVLKVHEICSNKDFRYLWVLQLLITFKLQSIKGIGVHKFTSKIKNHFLKTYELIQES
ncbi:glycosyltransferase family 2 protein [uncultured Kordia sp.]|uniref:glycosyltransferase family 2 protein n=1 Tax=uncultured Kordia sp. TaxID=507699 RepID=UPI0026105CE7|nr:glycosyltransferase family 2 protein [uncultured Kordia sp.]